jgi:hypothetical protein
MLKNNIISLMAFKARKSLDTTAPDNDSMTQELIRRRGEAMKYAQAAYETNPHPQDIEDWPKATKPMGDVALKGAILVGKNIVTKEGSIAARHPSLAQEAVNNVIQFPVRFHNDDIA